MKNVQGQSQKGPILNHAQAEIQARAAYNVGANKAVVKGPRGLNAAIFTPKKKQAQS